MKKIKITEVLIMSLKKKIAGVLLATMCTAFFAGCGGDNKSADSASGKKVQIEYWHVASESFGGQTVKELVKDFNEKHPDIEVVEKYNSLACNKLIPIFFEDNNRNDYLYGYSFYKKILL